MADECPHDVLVLPQCTNSEEKIRKAYEKLSQRCHPDRVKIKTSDIDNDIIST